MRIRFFLAVATASFVAAGFGIQACGGSSEDTGGDGADAAPEASNVAETGPKDSAAPDVFDARPPCDPNKDVLKDIPDAAIPDSSTTTGQCLGCAKTSCNEEITDCAKDCSASATNLGCQDLAATALQCYTQKQNFLACIGGFMGASTKTQSVGLALAGCVSKKCQAECGVPTDAGADSAM